jgi:hypothetical protein
MKNKAFIYLLMILISTSSLHALKSESLFNTNKEEEPRIFVNNRILAKINGKPISTIDVMKKMDVTFYRQYPQYASSTAARFQYYEMAWTHILEELIDKELILADAQESKIEVTSGDVRQEMESSFGPAIIANLDKVGLSFEEAAKIIQEEIIMRRMISGRVHAKALRQVTPLKVRQAYEAFIQDPANARSTQWKYRIVTVKERNLQKTEETAKASYKLLTEGVALDQLVDQLKANKVLGRKGNVTVSNSVQNNEQELSKTYQELLAGLDTKTYSQPFASKSRANNTTVYRILYVEEKIPGGVPSFKELEVSLKERLLDEAIDQETDLYFQKLRQHYHIRQSDLDALVPPNYEPFLLK